MPIVLATFALSEGLGSSDTIFNAVFFVVLVSALVQGPTLEPLARSLGLATESRPLYTPPLEIGALSGADLLEFVAGPDDALVGRPTRELGLPRAALVAVIVRGEEAVPPRGSTRVRACDRLYLLVRAESRDEAEGRFAAWRDGPLGGEPAPPG